MADSRTETGTTSHKTPSQLGDAGVDALLAQARAQRPNGELPELGPEVDESKLEPLSNETIPANLYVRDEAADARQRVADRVEASRTVAGAASVHE